MEFWEHSFFVLVLPVMLVVPVVLARWVTRVFVKLRVREDSSAAQQAATQWFSA
jgi:hypothetical protein